MYVRAEILFPPALVAELRDAGGNGLQQLIGKGIDLVLILDVYHHFDYPDKMLHSIAASLNKGGRVAIVDYYKRKGAMGGKDSDRALTHIRLDEADVVKEIEGYGFKLVSSNAFLPGVQYLAIFEKK